MTDRLPPRAAVLGGILLWFAVLGGAISWTVHAIVAWSIDELACAAGHDELAGFPLTTAVGLAVAIPAVGAVAALAISWLAWRRTRLDGLAGADRSVGRTHLLATIGLWLNLLSLSMIILGGVATLVLAPCQG
jgi:hypothetical protein